MTSYEKASRTTLLPWQRAPQVALLLLLLLLLALLACKRGSKQESSGVETVGTSAATPATTPRPTAPPPPSQAPPSEVFYPPIVPIPSSDTKSDISPRKKKLMEERDVLRLKIARGSGTESDRRALRAICKELDDKACLDGLNHDGGAL